MATTATNRRIRVVNVATGDPDVAYGPLPSYPAQSVPLTREALLWAGCPAAQLGTDWTCTVQILSTVAGVETGAALDAEETLTMVLWDSLTQVHEADLTCTIAADQTTYPGYFSISIAAADTSPQAGRYRFSLIYAVTREVDAVYQLGGGWIDIGAAVPAA